MNPITVQRGGDVEFAVKLLWQMAANDPQTEATFQTILSNPELTRADIFTIGFQMGIAFTMMGMVTGQIIVVGQGPAG